MSGFYTITSEAGVTRVRLHHQPDFNTIQRIIDDLAENHDYQHRLWDCSDARINMPMDEIRVLSAYERTRLKGPGKLAIIAPDDLTFGEMRAFGVYREDPLAKVMFFRSEDKALSWLYAEDNRSKIQTAR